jgi:hypothetical protein
VLVFGADQRGFAAFGNGEPGSDALIFSRSGEGESARQLYREMFESTELVGTYAVEPGNAATVTVTRGRNLLRPFAP